MNNRRQFDPNKHHRHSIRLKNYDYSQEGMYFITICIQNKEQRFGQIENGVMLLNDYGRIAHSEWEALSSRFPNTEIDTFVIMPNHMHGIILVKTRVKTVGEMIGAYKSLVANKCLALHISKHTVGAPIAGAHDAGGSNEGVRNVERAGASPAPTASVIPAFGKLWQRNYYEHVIRNEQSYHTIANYIMNNPANWSIDKFYT